MKPTEWITLEQLLKDYPAFTEPTVRLWLQRRKKNGLDKCINQVSRRLYIRRDLFEEWIMSHKA